METQREQRTAVGGFPTQAAECPRCGALLHFSERLLVGESLECNACNAALEVAYPDPPSLIPRARVEEEEAADV